MPLPATAATASFVSRREPMPEMSPTPDTSINDLDDLRMMMRPSLFVVGFTPRGNSGVADLEAPPPIYLCLIDR